MTKRNLILTDLMKTGNHLAIEKFFSHNSLPEKFDYVSDFYTLDGMDLTNYDRKFAIIDHRMDNHALWHSNTYWQDLQSRLTYLKEKNFVFILAYPWETHSNMSWYKQYDRYLEDVKTIKWSGMDNWFWVMMYDRYIGHTFKFDHKIKKFDFFYLNKVEREHRKKLFDLFVEKNLLDNSLFSFINRDIRLKPEYELPWVDAKNYPLYGHDRDIFEPPYNHTAINIVSESTVEGKVFITEKIWKPILAQQIFVVHAWPGYLEHLKTLGFKTYGNYFDESYDECKDQKERVRKIVKLCQHLKTIDYNTLYQNTQEVREHNAKHFFSTEHLSRSVNKTILNFLEFFDSSEIFSAES